MNISGTKHGRKGGKQVINDNWVKKSYDHCLLSFQYIWSYLKNRSKCSLIADLFKILITFFTLDFQPWFLGALSTPMSLVSFDV